MKKVMFLVTMMFISLVIVGVTHATIEEKIIWDPNGNLGKFTDPTPNFTTILTQLGDPATISVSGGGTALVTAVNGASSGDVIEIIDSLTYNGGIVITDKTDIVIRAADGASPVINCGVLGSGGIGLDLQASADRLVSNIGIKGLKFIDIRFSHVGSHMTGMGIASYYSAILENIVIEDCVFDNYDATKDQWYKGTAINLNKVDGLLIRRNTILNGGLHGSSTFQEDGAISVHEFGAALPNYLDNVFIQNNEILFDYTKVSLPIPSQTTRGIVLAHTGKSTTRFNNVVVEYNLIDNVQKEGIKVYGASVDTTDDETTHVSNNVIKRTADGIEMDGGVLLIDSTIFDGLTSFGAEGKNEAIDADGGTTTVTNTIVIEKTKGVNKATAATVTVTCIDLFNASLIHPSNNAGGTVSNVNPMFVDTSNNDYTIGNPEFPAGCAGGSFGLELIPVVSVIEVEIDIKPGSDPNCFNIDGHGVIPVAIQGSTDFDVLDIDVNTLSFEGMAVRVRGKGRPMCSFEDWNNDLFLDLVCHFEDDSTTWNGGTSTATVTGELLDGTEFEGTDSICIIKKIIPCDLLGDWLLSYVQLPNGGGTYNHDMTISTQSPDGSFSGTGGYPTGPLWTWIVTGTITDSTVSMTITYDQTVGGTYPYIVLLTGTVEACGSSMSGDASDNRGYLYTWTATHK